jgi:hypothetical protein
MYSWIIQVWMWFYVPMDHTSLNVVWCTHGSYKLECGLMYSWIIQAWMRLCTHWSYKAWMYPFDHTSLNVVLCTHGSYELKCGYVPMHQASLNAWHVLRDHDHAHEQASFECGLNVWLCTQMDHTSLNVWLCTQMDHTSLNVWFCTHRSQKLKCVIMYP